MRYEDFVNESRPKYIRYKLKKTKQFYTLKNEDENIRKIRLNQLASYLKNVNACDDKKPISSGMDFNHVKKQIDDNGYSNIYVPSNRDMKQTYKSKKAVKPNSKKYKFKDNIYHVGY